MAFLAIAIFLNSFCKPTTLLFSLALTLRLSFYIVFHLLSNLLQYRPDWYTQTRGQIANWISGMIIGNLGWFALELLPQLFGMNFEKALSHFRDSKSLTGEITIGNILIEISRTGDEGKATCLLVIKWISLLAQITRNILGDSTEWEIPLKRIKYEE